MTGTSRLRWEFNAMKRSGPLKRRTPLKRVGRKGQRDREAMDALRPALLERSGGKCEADRFSSYCTGVGAHAHHIWPSDRDKGIHDPARMAFVCVPCHVKIHEFPGAANLRGLLRKSWEAQ